MTSALDLITGAGMTGAQSFIRLRARTITDPYNPEQTSRDWTDPDTLAIRGALASGSSTRAPDGLREQTSSVAYLTVPDPTVDVTAGDRIRPEPADGRIWEVTGDPSRDVNAFTGWNPTTEIPLTEWKG